MKRRVQWQTWGVGVTLLASASVSAGPITFNSALPVAKGALINREILLIHRFKGDVTSANRDLEVNGLASVLVYGVTSKLALFGVLPYIDKNLDINGGQSIARHSKGIGDTKLFARYTFFKQDERGKTLRFAAFGGFKAPTGDDIQTDSFGRLPIPLQSGSGAWDTLGGVVMTYQTLDYEIDAQLSANNKGRANDFALGNEYRADVSLQYRLSPLEDDTHSFLYGVLEANLIHLDRNQLLGMDDDNSGGTSLFLSPGIQYVTPKYVLEAAVQLPVLQNLNGSALATDFIFTTGFRINF